MQLAQKKVARQKIVQGLLVVLCAIIVMIFITLILLNSPYLGWDYNDPETAVLGVGFHVFEWLFSRLAPIVLIGVFIDKKKRVTLLCF